MVRERWAEDTGFAARLRQLRETAGLSQEELAGLCRVHGHTVSRLELGQANPAWPLVLRLASALGVTPNDFRPQVDPKEVRTQQRCD